MPLLLHVLHVVGAVFVVGPTAILPMLALRTIRRGDPDATRALATSFLWFTVGSVVVALIGLGVMSTGDADDDWSLGTPWIAGSIALFMVAALLNLGVVYPILRKLGTAGGTDRTRTYPLLSVAAGVSSLLLVAVAVLMVAQP